MRKPRLLTICFPTFGQLNDLHLNSRGDAVVLAPDEFHRQLCELGWKVDVVSLADPTDKPLFRSGLKLLRPSDVEFDAYDVYWHMFRDPTQPEVMSALSTVGFDFSGKTVINHVDRLQHHHKHRYSKLLFDRGLAPEIVAGPPGDRLDWMAEESCRVSPDHHFIESCAFNNNRGDYGSARQESITHRYVDNAVDGLRSMVRFGYAFGQGYFGFQYFSRRLAFKSGGADRFETYQVEQHLQPAIHSALTELGIDICHIDAIPVGEELKIVDINPYPTANGRSLSAITDPLVKILDQRFYETLPGRENSISPGSIGEMPSP